MTEWNGENRMSVAKLEARNREERPIPFVIDPRACIPVADATGRPPPPSRQIRMGAVPRPAWRDCPPLGASQTRREDGYLRPRQSRKIAIDREGEPDIRLGEIDSSSRARDPHPAMPIVTIDGGIIRVPRMRSCSIAGGVGRGYPVGRRKADPSSASQAARARGQATGAPHRRPIPPQFERPRECSESRRRTVHHFGPLLLEPKNGDQNDTVADPANMGRNKRRRRCAAGSTNAWHGRA